MEIKKQVNRLNTSIFYSEKRLISKKSLHENHLKFIYQKQLISNLDSKHKEWSKSFGY
tara:strand:- start:531 stop:704 length:174 start_codon:yes stop_codon:yes gene_type:complete